MASAYSLFSEEQIVRELTTATELPQFCVDIGAGDGKSMSNSILLFEQGWSGMAAEMDPADFNRLARVHKSNAGVALVRLRVTPGNVLDMLGAAGTPADFGFLSLDIDGYDHFVLDKILSAYQPAVVCAEVNEKIPPPLRFTVLYSDTYAWDTSHFYGQSICQLELLCAKYGYAIVNLEYNNAFLMPESIAPRRMSAQEAYRSGYAERADRLQRLPWNRDMEHLQSMTPDEAAHALNERFADHRGEYILEY
jgi:hypothetical protein